MTSIREAEAKLHEDIQDSREEREEIYKSTDLPSNNARKYF